MKVERIRIARRTCSLNCRAHRPAYSHPVRLLLSAILAAGTPTLLAPALAQSPPRAVPVEPIPAILDAFRSHALVALGEGQHWNEQGHAFRLSLIRDPGFAAVVDDIVVEFGNLRYQGVLDRFIAGGDVPYDTLRHVWENTTSPNEVWDMPIYAEFLRAVRDVNAGLAGTRRLRVLLADPPVDWDRVRGKEDILPWLSIRDSVAAGVVEREVIAKKRRALLIFGDGHLWRKGDGPTVVSLLERSCVRIFVITTPTSSDLTTLQSDVPTWRVPSLAALRGSALGKATFSAFYQFPDMRAAPWDTLTMSEEVDAVLYLGPPGTITLSRLSSELCADSAYLRMRLGRLGLVPWGAGEISRIRRRCEAPR